jgi:DNA-binding SARP family transcriptional activator/predicted ATPase/TolA-binding protein
MKLELSLLGHVEIRRDGLPVRGFVSTKVEALLIYLAATGQPHRRESLAGLLWGNKSDERARGNLRKALSNLRRLVGESVLVSGQTVTFNRDAVACLDVAVFEAALAINQANPENLTALAAAVEEYRDDFLTGFTVEEALPFEEWLLVERERLRRLVIQALYRLGAAYTARGEYAAGIEVTSRLLALEPWQEEAHRQMMTLLARSGQQAAALAQYETCRRILARELGVEPLPETQALYRRLKTRGRPSPHNLPPPATPFVGREKELAYLAQTLDRPDCRLLTLVGLGGVGKTRLALQAAAEQLPSFKDGVFFVPLVGIGSARLLAAAIAKPLPCSLSGPGEAGQQLINCLAGREMLLVLDSFEHLRRGEEEVLVKLLSGAPGVKLLVTSRRRLNLHEEWVIEVGGLEFPQPEGSAGLLNPELAQPDLQNYSAIRLFVQQAQRVQADFSLSACNQAEIVRLCQLVNGTPLGLELAAAWVPLLSCAEIATEIERDLDFLTTSAGNIPDRHRSMRAVFESTWDLLSAPEQDVLRRLAVFKGKFQREAAIHVTGASLQLLLALVNKSLLRRDAAGRYDMHELLRQFAAEKLAANADNAAQARHSRYYLTFLHERESALQGGAQPETLKDIGDAWENIQLAWRWAAAQGQLELVEQAGLSLFLFCETQSRFQEGEAFFQYALDCLAKGETMVSASPENCAHRALGKMLAYQGRLLYHRGLYSSARTMLEKSLAVAEQSLQPETVAFSRHTLGLVAVMQGDYEPAKQLAQESVRLCRQLNDGWGEAWSLYTWGWADYYLGDYGPAQQSTQKSLNLHRQLRNRHGEAACLNTLGLIVCAVHEQTLAQHPEAREFFEQNLAIRQAIGDHWGEAVARHNLGYLHWKLRQYDLARTWFRGSLAISTMLGALQMIAATRMWLGMTALEQGRQTEAGQCFMDALKLGYQQRGLGRVMDTLFRLADLYRRQGQIELAVEYLTVVQYQPATDDRVREGATLLLAELAPHVPPSSMAAAQNRGRNRNLDQLIGEILAEQDLVMDPFNG